MKWMHSFIPVLLISVAVLHSGASAKSARVDQAAPDFSLMDSHGKKHSLSDFKGKWVVLEWVNFGCPYVRKHYDSKNMQSLQKAYADKEVVWLSICSSAPGKQGFYEGDELTSQTKEEGSNATAYLIDAEGTVGRMYEAKTTPHMYIVNPEGILVYMGGIDNIASSDKGDIAKATNYVRQALDSGLAGKEIAIKTSKSYGCSVKYK